MNRESSSLSPPIGSALPVRVLQTSPETKMGAKMREWLSGRASPCQGEGRGFDPRLPLQVYLRAAPGRMLSAPVRLLTAPCVLFDRQETGCSE